MDRRSFIQHGCACSLMLLADQPQGSVIAAEADKPQLDNIMPVKSEQIIAVLNDIDQSQDKALIDAVFTRWGYQCFQTRHDLVAFAKEKHKNFQGYVDYINSGQARFWEKLDYDEPKGILKVTGRKSEKCVCAYAQCLQPAKSLCTHCCKQFQAELFKTMTGHEAEVEITESILLGGQRCCTTVRLGKGIM